MKFFGTYISRLGRSHALPIRGRIRVFDVARGVALVAMAIYHFTWDLEYFHYVPAGLTAEGGWKIFARCIAGSFLFLVGISLVLAHGGRIKWRPFFGRLAMIVLASLAITIVTYLMMPQRYVFFGILHCIALSSLLGLAFLRLPPVLIALAGFMIIFLSPYLHTTLFDHPLLNWIGLSTYTIRSNDYVPLFPWFGPVLIGISVGKVLKRTDGLARLGALYPANDPVGQGLSFLGRHSLAFYLIHQPLLYSIVFVFSLFFQADLRPVYSNLCNPNCAQNDSIAFCQRYCQCTGDKFHEAGLLEDLLYDRLVYQGNDTVTSVVSSCTAESRK
ncbi:heparan-alpha-glucosaminide N-acetyltransferase [Hoeflea sp. CAU 1731]